MGEAGPEAIMPLTRTSSGRLGVQAQGTSGAVNVVVNVSSDGTGTTKTSTTKNQDFSMGNALGRLVGTAVQSEMMNQMRPGGILWKWRAGRV
jgi:phage-related minor tail protein